MANGLTKSDLEDIDFVDACELISDGYQTTVGKYLESTIISTTSGSKEVSINLPADQQGLVDGTDHPAESGDFVWIFGTSGGAGDGYYTIGVVVDDTLFSVLETLPSSTGGNLWFFHPSGASQIGIKSTNTVNFTSNNLQIALEEIDSAISSGGGGAPTGPAGGDLSGTYPNPVVNDLTITSEEQGSVLYFDGANWVQLAPGVDGNVLTTHSSGADPAWESPTAVSLPIADNCGQILISGDDNLFEPRNPLVNNNGCLLTNGEYHMVYC